MGHPQAAQPESVSLNGILIGLLKFDEATFDSGLGDDRLTIASTSFRTVRSSTAARGRTRSTCAAACTTTAAGPGCSCRILSRTTSVGGTGIFNAYAQKVLPSAWVQINTGGRINLAGDGSVMKSTNFVMADGSVMDIRNGTLIVDGTSNTVLLNLQTLTQLVGNGRNARTGGRSWCSTRT